MVVIDVVALDDSRLRRCLYGINGTVREDGTISLIDVAVSRYVPSLSTFVAHFAGRVEGAPIGRSAIS